MIGSGITESDWLTGDRSITLGSSDQIARFGDIASDTIQSADFGVVKNELASLGWVKHFIAEDFTSGRVLYRDESADPNSVYTDLSLFQFGRCYKAKSYIEFIGLGMDPSPFVQCLLLLKIQTYLELI